MSPKEEWRTVPGHPAYQVSSKGRVRVLQRWRKGARGPRNVLLEDVETGKQFVRPFRGLRRLPWA